MAFVTAFPVPTAGSSFTPTHSCGAQRALRPASRRVSITTRTDEHDARDSGHQPATMLFGLFRRDPPIDIAELSKTHPAIRVQNLTKTFTTKVKGASRKKEKKTITAVDNLSFTVERGSIFSLLGPNSSGKTSTLRCLSTLSNPDSGTIEYFGIDAIKNDASARKMVGFVLQSAGLDKILTGREHLDFFGGLAHISRRERSVMIEMLIERFRLAPYIDQLTSVYSGGIIRRLDLAIALLHRPPILILDEPTVGLDIESRQVIWDVLREWRADGGTVVLTSHYLEEVDVLSDRVAILDRGVMIANGTPTQLKNNLGGDRISIRLEEFTDVQRAEGVLFELERRALVLGGVINRFQNNALELVVDPENAAIGSTIVQALSELGYDKLFSFAQSKPSLNDVYLAATGSSIQDVENSAKAGRSEKSVRQESMS